MSDAAELYAKAEHYEKAAAIYNNLKNWRKAAPLMERITVPKLHLQYAKAKEAERSWKEAEVAYERAKDVDSVIRLNLNKLDNAAKAFALVSDTMFIAQSASRLARGLPLPLTLTLTSCLPLTLPLTLTLTLTRTLPLSRRAASSR